MFPRAYVIAFSTVLCAVACGGERAAAPATATPGPMVSSALTSASNAKEETLFVSPSVAVSEDLARACALHFHDVKTAPKFGFDNTDLSTTDEGALEKIGRCITDGPMSGRAITLVGRTDPRGPTEYNLALGARRADAVATFLANVGVDPQRIKATSRGELDAMGTDESTWQLDRRVDIRID